MRTAIDTNILSLFWSGGSLAVTIDAQLSKLRAEGALVVSAPVFVELSAIPTGNPQRVEKLLDEMNIAVDFDSEKMSGDSLQRASQLTPSAVATPAEVRQSAYPRTS